MFRSSSSAEQYSSPRTSRSSSGSSIFTPSSTELSFDMSTGSSVSSHGLERLVGAARPPSTPSWSEASSPTHSDHIFSDRLDESTYVPYCNFWLTFQKIPQIRVSGSTRAR